jgi:hypothetical protein
MNRHIPVFITGIIAFTLAACSFTNPPCLRIGAAQAEIRKVTSKYYATHPVGSEYEIIENKDPALRIRTGFEHGVCNRISYTSVTKQKISQHTISIILSLNSGGVAWIVDGDPGSDGKVYYHSVDGKYRAQLTGGTSLFVVTDAIFQKTMREIDAENQAPKAPTPYQK